MGFDFLYIVVIFYDVNSLSGSLKYAECVLGGEACRGSSTTSSILSTSEDGDSGVTGRLEVCVVSSSCNGGCDSCCGEVCDKAGG